jgi:hypothetical protein
MEKKLLANINVDFKTVNQIFVTDRRKLKVHWNNTSATSYDSVRRGELYNILVEFGHP